jgi:hypothetical protein
MLKLLDLKQGSNTWLEERGRRITASDARLLLLYFEKNQCNYYDSNVYKILEDKLIDKKINNDFKLKLFREGHMAEELISSKIKDEIREQGWNYYSGQVWGYKNLLASLDVSIEKNNNFVIYECKNVNSKRVLEQYINYSHPNYYQVAFQLYLLSKKYDNAKAYIICYEMESENLYKFEVDKTGEHYKAVEKHIDKLLKCGKNISESKDALFDIAPSNGSIGEDRSAIVELANKYLKVNDKIDILKQEKDIIKGELFNILIRYKSGLQDRGVSAKAGLVERYKKKIKPEVVDILNKNGYNNIEDIYINDLDSLKIIEQIYINRIRT